MKIVECIPNFSEARRPEVVEAIINAVSESGGVHILDQHSDLTITVRFLLLLVNRKL